MVPEGWEAIVTAAIVIRMVSWENQERERPSTLKDTPSSTLFPTARLHLLKVLCPPSNSATTWDQVFRYLSTFSFKPSCIKPSSAVCLVVLKGLGILSLNLNLLAAFNAFR